MTLTSLVFQLRSKLDHVDRLIARASTQGELQAAKAARSRLIERLAKMGHHFHQAKTDNDFEFSRTQQEQEQEMAVEYRFSVEDVWHKLLLVEILEYHQIRSFRRPSQKNLTVRAIIKPSFLDKVIWPQYLRYSEKLEAKMSQVGQQFVRQARESGFCD